MIDSSCTGGGRAFDLSGKVLRDSRQLRLSTTATKYNTMKRMNSPPPKQTKKHGSATQTIQTSSKKNSNKATVRYDNRRSTSHHSSIPHPTVATSRELAPSVVHPVEIVEKEPLREVLAGVNRPREGDIPVGFIPHVGHVRQGAGLLRGKRRGKRGIGGSGSGWGDGRKGGALLERDDPGCLDCFSKRQSKARRQSNTNRRCLGQLPVIVIVA